MFLNYATVNEFFALTAVDRDTGVNGQVSYAIVEGNEAAKFGIFPDGLLYVRSPLDREVKDYYALTVLAKDNGTPSRRQVFHSIIRKPSRIFDLHCLYIVFHYLQLLFKHFICCVNSTTVSVTIHVIDENDNPPKFNNETFSFYLPENEPPDSYVGRLTATDRDIGRNAELTFSIATSQNDFTIDPKSGFIKTLRYFDRERLLQTSGQDYVVLEAVVTDNGVSRLRDRARIHVYIMGMSFFL